MPMVSLANGRSFRAEPGVSVLDAALLSGLTLEHSCRTGRCGSCKTQVLAGASAPLRDETSLSAAESADGWILTCTREATSDLVIDAEDLAALAGVVPKTLPCRIARLELSAPDVMTVTLRLPPTARFAFLAGQYVDVIGPGGIQRSYSLASAMDAAGTIELHVRRVDDGVMSRYWFEQARADDLLRFRGPLGTFFLRDVAGLDLVFLATGTGYAPIHSMLAQLAALDAARRPASVHLYWGGRIRADVYADPAGLLPGLRFTPVLSRADASWDGARGHVQDVFLATRPSLGDAAVYACGSDAMIESARGALAAAGLAPRRFLCDAFVSSS